MADITVTASLARSGIPAKAIHAGVNSIVGSFRFSDLYSASMTTTAVVLLCKIPSNCRIIDVQEEHSTGTDTMPVEVGYRKRDGSLSVSAFIADGTKATVNRMAAVGSTGYHFTAVSGTEFVYVAAKYIAGSATNSVFASYTVLYSIDQEES